MGISPAACHISANFKNVHAILLVLELGNSEKLPWNPNKNVSYLVDLFENFDS